MSNSHAITVIDPATNVDTERIIALRSAWNIQALKERLDNILYLREQVMIKGIHYGPPYKGSKKDVLLKPGAELLFAFFGLRPDYVERSIDEVWDPAQPLFHYRYECQIFDIITGVHIGSGIGSCNSMESKYRWRTKERVCPECGQPTIRKSNYADRQTGDMGFYCNKKDGGCGANFHSGDKRITEQELGRVPNDDVFSMVNTIDKQAQKRSMLAGILTATGASAFFTQDVEDFRGYEYFGDPDAIDGTGSEPPAWIFSPEEMLRFGEFLEANHLKTSDIRQQTGVNILAFHTAQDAQAAITAALKQPPPAASTKSSSPPEGDHWLNQQGAAVDAWLAAHSLKRFDVKRMTGKPIGEYASLEAVQKDIEIALSQQPPPPTPQAAPQAADSSVPEPSNAKTKPAANPDTWTDERKLNAGRWVRDNFDISSDEMLKLLGKPEWTDFAKPSDVPPAVLAIANQRQVAVVARSLVYTTQGRGDKAKKICVLKTVIGDFVVFGGREGLTTKLGKEAGAQFAATHQIEAWEPNTKVTHDLSKLPIKAIWTWKQQDVREIVSLTLVKPDEVDFTSDAPPSTAAEQVSADAAFAQI